MTMVLMKKQRLLDRDVRQRLRIWIKHNQSQKGSAGDQVL